ncbi:thiol reductant ABC exporter subunit CydD [Lacticaseibacillus baoqingensis]|uniref:Thiol reductant ABC exporter subunit CydD n=1 Tax=Lacticaseibacillus baoqingensis TaxID=2486013 RepID=A0ABW4E5S7_9LACO|nr:thiol reductant ABC exporter subunit CydD [Lacticaseibacillus baoqingensis]
MIDKRLLRLPGVQQVMIGLAILTVLQAVVIILQGHFLALGIVHSWAQKALVSLWPFIWGFAGAFAARQVLTWGRNRLAENFARRLADKIQQRLIKQLYALGPQAVAHAGTGNAVTMALDGIIEVQQYLELILNKLLNMGIIPWFIVGYIFWENHLAGIALVIMFPVIILFMIILGYAARDKSQQQYAGFQQMSNHFIDSLRGLKTLQLMGISKAYADNVYAVSERYRKQTMGVLQIAMLSSFAMDFFATLSIAVVAVFLGIDLLHGSVSLYPGMVCLILAPEYFMPIREFGNDYHATLNGKNALAAILDLLDQPAPQLRQALPAYTGWQSDSTLTVSALNYQYADRTGIKDAAFTISGDMNVALIGASGSGKSTLLNLLGGFLQPQSGTPFVVDGQPVADLNDQAWQAHLSYIPQHPYVFADTIANNVRFYRPEADDAAVAQALQAAGLTDWVATLADGVNTRIGEGGRGISGGQAQRIALARTLIDQKRSVWLFDEPTAHLDIETEAALKNTMTPLFAGRLVIMATHRLHWLQQMDLVLVLDQGQIVAAGAPAELAAHSTAYQALVAQMRGEFDV